MDEDRIAARCTRDGSPDHPVSMEGAAMATKIELFRAVNAGGEEIVERLIVLWGSPDIHAYVGGLLRGAGAQLDEPVRTALAEVTELHNQEFPQHAEKPREPVPPGLAANANYQIIDARFPRIGRRLAETWGQVECVQYINELMNDKRLGRQGFPPDVASALMMLSMNHDKEFPQFVVNTNDIWILDHKIW
jgi:hypothetical protein